MTVAQLIAVLQALPADAAVLAIWDGGARTDVENAYLARGGYVCLAASEDVVYENEDRPADAPSKHVDAYWKTPKAGNPLAWLDR